METKTLDNNTQASNPGGVQLSPAKLKRIQPELYSLPKWLGFLASNPSAAFAGIDRGFWKLHIEEHLMHGDSGAAIVVAKAPLLIAAYSVEIDCIALLRFDDLFADEYRLEVGSRLISVNTYSVLAGAYEKDLTPGPDEYGRYGNFSPFIAEFLTDELPTLQERIGSIENWEWVMAKRLADQYLSQPNAQARDGRPLFCSLPASLSIIT